jgi:hypothetical protein
MAGYSGTPLNKKLGIKPGFCIYAKNAPTAYIQMLQPLPGNIQLLKRIGSNMDMVHVFFTEKEEILGELSQMLKHIKADGMIWASWPKKSAKLPTNITEDIIRNAALTLGLVDIKVCAVDEIWSALKLVIRKELRKKRTNQ